MWEGGLSRGKEYNKQELENKFGYITTIVLDSGSATDHEIA